MRETMPSKTGTVVLSFIAFLCIMYLLSPAPPQVANTSSTFTMNTNIDTQEISDVSQSTQDVKYFINFGDSYSSSGFNPAVDHPSALNPLGNPAFPGDTTCGGPNWVGDLVTKYNTSVVLAYNYAYGGATVNAKLAPPYLPTVVSMEDQITRFIQPGGIGDKPSYVEWSSNNTLFGIWIGINDIGQTIDFASDVFAVTIPQIFEKIFTNMNNLYAVGARTFVLLTVPPTDRTPAFLAESSDFQALVRARITQWNTLLSEGLEAYGKRHTDVKLITVDTQPIFNDLLDAAGSNATCFNSDNLSCLWWNNYHPGLKIQDAIAKAVAEQTDFF